MAISLKSSLSRGVLFFCEKGFGIWGLYSTARHNDEITMEQLMQEQTDTHTHRQNDYRSFRSCMCQGLISCHNCGDPQRAGGQWSIESIQSVRAIPFVYQTSPETVTIVGVCWKSDKEKTRSECAAPTYVISLFVELNVWLVKSVTSS